MRRKVFFILMIVWMIVIFAFSSREGSVSTEDSNTVGLLVGSIVYSDFESWPQYQQIEFAKKIDHPIRKMGHVSEYLLLSILALGTVIPQINRFTFEKNDFWGLLSAKAKYKLYVYILLGVIISFIYAATDEFHQYFVQGRSAEFKDVMIDSIGIVIGAVLCGMICLSRLRRSLK